MAFTWTPKQIDWYEKASSYGSFHRQLASFLVPFLQPDDTVCDWGCGLGKLSLELAPYVARLTCVDRDPQVLEALRKEIRRRGFRNMEIVEGDAGKLALDCQVGLMAFFGHSYELMSRCIDLSGRLLIRVIDTGSGMEGAGWKRAEDIERSLLKEGRSFSKERARLEFGQPFTSRRDALDFLGHYKPDKTRQEAEAYLEEHLLETGGEAFPYYLPKVKHLLIYAIAARA
ncbi:MAG TPA: methyltransferase domain-containing protein [Bacillota bacterium]|jgi:precorrin-6B methylase 2|nr:methyltransferase domain-containing protein [Fastidiosipila sp.]HPX93741.1 methyltransferase domain-containing protein [Bacillota bacterium]HQB81588.1 methyltransferase domain-containing protein [Bacillota bacterium]